jgi:4-aminobutyrate aminotransferase-like enzyme
MGNASIATSPSQFASEVGPGAFEAHDDIACCIVEPIQAEGGDNHFRAEFEFMRQLATVALNERLPRLM